jgi:hypothetical protein
MLAKAGRCWRKVNPSTARVFSHAGRGWKMLAKSMRADLLSALHLRYGVD